MSSQLPPEVPAGWSAQWSGTHQKWLYIELASLRSQWDFPSEASLKAMPTPPLSPTSPSQGYPSVPTGWRALWHDKYGAWYYVNSQTGKSQWQRPQHAARPAIDYSPIDFSTKPDWDQLAPSPLSSTQQKKKTIIPDLTIDPVVSVDELFYTSPAPPPQERHSPVPSLRLDTQHAQSRQRPISQNPPVVTFPRPRAISDAPPVLPDIPISAFSISQHPSPLNPFAKAQDGLLQAPGAGVCPSQRQIRHSISGPPAGQQQQRQSLTYGSSYGSVYSVAAKKSQPELTTMPTVTPEEKKRKFQSWGYPITPPATLTPPANPTTAPPPPPPPKVPPPPPPEPAQITPPLGAIRQQLRTDTVGFGGVWPTGAQDRGYYPTRVDTNITRAGDDGYESDSSYYTEYADDEDQVKSPALNFQAPVSNGKNNRESWELSY